MRFRVAAYGVIIRNGQILLAHWNARGRNGWTLPGGGLEAGEDPYDAAVREIWEETGYHASIDQLLGIDSIIVNGRNRRRKGRPVEAPLQGVRIVYLASITGGELRPEENGTTDEARWFDLREVRRLQTVSLVRVAMRLYHERPRNGHLEGLGGPKRRGAAPLGTRPEALDESVAVAEDADLPGPEELDQAFEPDELGTTHDGFADAPDDVDLDD